MNNLIEQIKDVIDPLIGQPASDDYLRGAQDVANTIDGILDDQPADPLLPVDPEFPDRPQTLDFARLSGVVRELDEVEDVGASIASLLDEDSLTYMMQHRLGQAINSLPQLRLGVMLGALDPNALGAIYLDAFMTGVEFQKRGGHRPDTTTEGEAR